MLFSPNKGHSLIPDHPIPHSSVSSVEGKSVIIKGFLPPTRLFYNEISLDTQQRDGIKLTEISPFGFLSNTIEDKFDTLNEFKSAIHQELKK